MAKIGKICKEEMIKELSSKLKGGSNIFVTDCSGLSVLELGKLRGSLRNEKTSYFIVKNSLGKLALKNVDRETLAPLLEGTIGIALGGTDPISVSKTLLKFSKDTGKLRVKGGIVDGNVVNENEIKQIALLEPKQVLLARAFGGMKAPITNFVNVLNGAISKIVYAIEAIRKKKEGGNN
ncbi:MAG: 50S ribosomal protein L10 [Candidatus Omnitrophica bacterium]|nr:50S ribosomal protein L10 [Candidatus Omnitrophota bacterium]